VSKQLLQEISNRVALLDERVQKLNREVAELRSDIQYLQSEVVMLRNDVDKLRRGLNLFIKVIIPLLQVATLLLLVVR